METGEKQKEESWKNENLNNEFSERATEEKKEEEIGYVICVICHDNSDSHKHREISAKWKIIIIIINIHKEKKEEMTD